MTTASATQIADNTTQVAASVRTHPYRFLGSFRFLLALLVLISHASGFLSDQLVPLGLGNIGVLLFFVVSGFVICEALDLFYRGSATRFLLNRGLKIFPAYWAALPIGYAVAWLATPETLRGDPFALLINVTLLPAYLPAGGTLLVLSITWAVVIEFQFYFAAAAIAFAGRASGQRALMTLGAALAALALYLVVWRTGGQARFYGGFQFAPFFVFGSLAYFFIARRDGRLLPLLVFAFLLSVHAYYLYGARGEIAPGVWLGDDGTRWNLIWSTTAYIVLSVLFLALAAGRFQQRFERIDKRSGDITYAIYLVHTPMLLLATYLGLAGVTGFGFVLTASLTVAIAIQRGIERPVMGLRNLLRGSRLYD
jgi:peptidoglycan/LPS O-acetylase OafA/YrhL